MIDVEVVIDKIRVCMIFLWGFFFRAKRRMITCRMRKNYFFGGWLLEFYFIIDGFRKLYLEIFK